MYCVETTGLFHRYENGESILNGIDLQVPERSIYGFLGPNGAGKTTTLRLLLGLLKKQRGTISIFGKCIDANRLDVLRDIGSLIESPSLYAHLTASENLAVLRQVLRCPKRRIGEVLELVGLAHTGKKKTGEFSLGMKQRMGLAIALLHAPSLLILDEPTNGLDPNGILEMRRLLASPNREHGITVVISSHLLAEIEKLATHLGIIHRGRLVFQGTIDALRGSRLKEGSAYLRTNADAAALRIVATRVPDAMMVDGQIVLPALAIEEVASINRSLVESGIDVHEIGPIGRDLESIFMDLVSEQSA